MLCVTSAVVTVGIDQSAADWSKEKYSFGQAASVMIDRVRGEILIISAYPNGAEFVFDLAVFL